MARLSLRSSDIGKVGQIHCPAAVEIRTEATGCCRNVGTLKAGFKKLKVGQVDCSAAVEVGCGLDVEGEGYGAVASAIGRSDGHLVGLR